MTRRRSLLAISNGHGEDVVAARVLAEVARLRPDVALRAFPTVGEGGAYDGTSALRIGPLRALPGGGKTVETREALFADLRAGLLSVTAAQLRDLRAQRPDVVVAVGDVWAATLALAPRARSRYQVQTLVSARMDDGRPAGARAFRERFTRAERVLQRRACTGVFVRDDPSVAYLRTRGVANAAFVGNPMMDGLDVAPLDLDGPGPRVVLLPGTRSYATAALDLLLRAIAELPVVTAVLPWAAGALPSPPQGWSARAERAGARVWSDGRSSVHVVPNAFAAALAWADLAAGASGTAHEQAAGRGLPVVAFPCGPLYTRTFLENQRRLLGDAVEVVPPWPAAIARAIGALGRDPSERRRRGAIGRERMGPPGGSRRIARALVSDRWLMADGGLGDGGLADGPRAAADVASTIGDT